MRKSKVIVIDGREITAWELTPLQIDAVMSTKDSDRVAPSLPILLRSDLPTDVVIASTGIKKEQLLEDFTLEQLAEIWSAAEEVNRFLLIRLAEALKAALAIANRTESGGLSA